MSSSLPPGGESPWTNRVEYWDFSNNPGSRSASTIRREREKVREYFKVYDKALGEYSNKVTAAVEQINMNGTWWHDLKNKVLEYFTAINEYLEGRFPLEALIAKSDIARVSTVALNDPLALREQALFKEKMERVLGSDNEALTKAELIEILLAIMQEQYRRN
ncbi:MAG: hypothetical protein O3C63_04965 [Cyanobacteria bacterium]|nr:hypothetical protein [Cyanobacteriota bacterium]MDA1020659.1 hypothetical protein [Cyanobacteriota bacterium]